jgi:farnesyl-diphosphate farnesyltransferase
MVLIVDHENNARDALLSDLLERTSRTFALSIPLLPAPLKREVAVAYLLFRIADTIEDEADWPPVIKASCLRRVAEMLRDGEGHGLEELAGLVSGCEVDHEGYALLMARSSEVVGAYLALPSGPRRSIARHLARTCDGMAARLLAGAVSGDLRRARSYCYTVAGIVGELLTELFIEHHPALLVVTDELAGLAPCFGEGLQLVNILRDEGDDASAGRRYLPEDSDRIALMSLARDDLLTAVLYIRLLEQHGAEPGTVAFNALNLALAFETLGLIASRGPGAKLGRDRVNRVVSELRGRVERGEAIAPVLRERYSAGGRG